jgi:hypothetical protein
MRTLPGLFTFLILSTALRGGTITVTGVEGSTSYGGSPGAAEYSVSGEGFSALPASNGMDGLKIFGQVELQNLSTGSTFPASVNLQTAGGAMTGVPAGGFLLNVAGTFRMDSIAGQTVTPLAGANVYLDFYLQNGGTPISSRHAGTTAADGSVSLGGDVFIPGGLSVYDWSVFVGGSSDAVAPGQGIRLTVPQNSVDLTAAPAAGVPEPATGALVAVALGLLAYRRRTR